jgi:hypothetical protein
MTQRSIHHQFWLYLLTLMVVGGMLGAVKVNHLWQRSQVISDCPGSTLSPNHGPLVTLHPQKVVVAPWKGRHHVYAMFVVPAGYQPDEFVTVTFADGQAYCAETKTLRPHIADDLSVPPGHYVVQALLRTRTTIGLLSSGKKAELEQPQNWTLATQKNWW